MATKQHVQHAPGRDDPRLLVNIFYPRNLELKTTMPLLSTRDLIARMTPTALAEMIASIGQAGNLDADETQTVVALHQVLSANVGCAEAAAMVNAAKAAN